MKCKKCGTELEKNVNVCPECKTKVTSKKKTVLISVLVFIVLVTVGVILFFIPSVNNFFAKTTKSDKDYLMYVYQKNIIEFATSDQKNEIPLSLNVSIIPEDKFDHMLGNFTTLIPEAVKKTEVTMKLVTDEAIAEFTLTGNINDGATIATADGFYNMDEKQLYFRLHYLGDSYLMIPVKTDKTNKFVEAIKEFGEKIPKDTATLSVASTYLTKMIDCVRTVEKKADVIDLNGKAIECERYYMNTDKVFFVGLKETLDGIKENEKFKAILEKCELSEAFETIYSYADMALTLLGEPDESAGVYTWVDSGGKILAMAFDDGKNGRAPDFYGDITTPEEYVDTSDPIDILSWVTKVDFNSVFKKIEEFGGSAKDLWNKFMDSIKK